MKKHLALLLSTFNLLFFFSMKTFWSGIESMLGSHAIQYIVLGLLVVLVIVSIINELIFKSLKIMWVLFGISAALFIGLFFMYYMGRDYTYYVLRSFTKGLILVAGIAILWFFIYLYPKLDQEKLVIYKHVLFVTVVVSLIISALGLFFMRITNEPVVYAVEDTYQIVWSTNVHATAEVKVGNETYYDLYAGSEDSQTLIHKVVVPMSELDQEGRYQIVSKHVLYRGPFSGVLGGTVTKDYDFYPVDSSDGLNYFTLADSHGRNSASTKAGSYFGDDLDFLILGGDIISLVETTSDISIINKLAFNITQGSHPVVYARGNHELKSDKSNELYKYVGSLNENYYYTVTMDDIFMVVLDLGEDHADDWWEYYDTAQYDSYRDAQTLFLEDLIDSGVATDATINYRIAVSHIPLTFVDIYEDYSAAYKETWTNLLNQLNIDMSVSGHYHSLWPLLTDLPANQDLIYDDAYSDDNAVVGYHTDADFASFVVSRRSNIQDETVGENYFGKAYTGLATSVDTVNQTISAKYINALGEKVEVMDPFTGVVQYEFDLTY